MLDDCTEEEIANYAAIGEACMDHVVNRQENDKIKQRFKDVHTLTDLCCHEGQSEVHLVSLLEERIPRYTLRADTMTSFVGYENEDWTIKIPCLSSDLDPELSIDLMEETFKYFTLGGARLSQVTKTYNDFRALTLLLEEKEHDLEIASEIGKILIKRVRRLDKTVERLAEDMELTKTQVLALKKELTTRDSLLRVYVKDFDSDSEPENDDQNITSDYTSVKISTVNTEAICRRVKGLQSDNDKMGSAMVKLEIEAQEADQRENQLVIDCIEHLVQTNCTIEFLRGELDSKTECVTRLQDELSTYVEQILTLEGKSRQLNEELHKASRKVLEAENQKQMAESENEVWRRRYGECLSLLQAAQDEIKILRKAQRPANVIHRNYSRCDSVVISPFLPIGSLASELHDSQRKNLFYHFGYSPSAINSHSRKVMDVAKAVSRASSQRCLVASESQIFTAPDSEASSSVDLINDRDSLESQCGSSGHISLDLFDTELSDDPFPATSQTQRQAMADIGKSTLGQPGLPGSNDLEMALMRLNSPALLQSNSQNDAWRICHSPSDYTDSRMESPAIVAETTSRRTDFSRSLSNESNESNKVSVAILKPTIPEKLLIVKPLGGSTTLNQWKSLCISNFDDFLEMRPGVQTRDQPLVQQYEDEIFSLSDYEEDLIPAVAQVPLSTTHSPNNSDCHKFCCDLEKSQFEPLSICTNETSQTEIRRQNCIPNITTETSHPFYDFGPQTLPDIVTREKTSTGLTQVPKAMPSCSVM